MAAILFWLQCAYQPLDIKIVLKSDMQIPILKW